MKEIEIEEIDFEKAERMVVEYHYLNSVHPSSNTCLGGFIDGELMGVMTLRWSIRPDLTIQKCFPSMDRHDYKIIGRLCTVEHLPQNAESHFISKCIKYIQKTQPDLKVLFTWADGIMGKPGIVYQASNFWHGGWDWTEAYITDKGERVHPAATGVSKQLSGGGRETNRPSFDKVKEWGWRHVKSKQHRYVYFLCEKNEYEEYIENSKMQWSKSDHPKHDDLVWKEKTDSGWVEIEKPDIDTEVYEYKENAEKRVNHYKNQPELSAFTEENVDDWKRMSESPETEYYELQDSDNV